MTHICNSCIHTVGNNQPIGEQCNDWLNFQAQLALIKYNGGTFPKISTSFERSLNLGVRDGSLIMVPCNGEPESYLWGME